MTVTWICVMSMLIHVIWATVARFTFRVLRIDRARYARLKPMNKRSWDWIEGKQSKPAWKQKRKQAKPRKMTLRDHRRAHK